MENTVTLSLDRYNQLLTDKYIAQEELRYERKKLTHLNDMKNYILEKSFDEYKIKTKGYSLEDLTDITSYYFALNNPVRLLKFGFEIDEMIEFIKYKYEQYRKEQEVKEDE